MYACFGIHHEEEVGVLIHLIQKGGIIVKKLAMTLPDQAPVIAIHCGYDEQKRSFGDYYIRPVENAENGDAQATVDKRILYNGYKNPNSYAEWQPLSSEYWHQGTMYGG